MSFELKIKSKNLTAEARIIRDEEIKAARVARKLRDKQNREGSSNHFSKCHSLAHHRTTVVRYEARATFLARAYLSGKTYEHVEREGRKVEGDTVFRKVILPKVQFMVNKYGNMSGKKQDWVSMSQIESWAGLSEVEYD